MLESYHFYFNNKSNLVFNNHFYNQLTNETNNISISEEGAKQHIIPAEFQPEVHECQQHIRCEK